tara:strand:- start:187 stop:552 length:366 start_codon:yes stop_codon:yes gene_type:complete
MSEKYESHDAFMKRMMQEDSAKKGLSEIELLKKDMKELTECYYNAIKRIKELNDDVSRLKAYLTATHEMRKVITPETSEEKLRHYINVTADLRKKIDQDEVDVNDKYDGEAPSTIASFYKN